jgi:hypothetical protein
VTMVLTVRCVVFTVCSCLVMPLWMCP